jgi:hypothetical protein
MTNYRLPDWKQSLFRLELYAGKLARTVLRGAHAGDGMGLPDSA